MHAKQRESIAHGVIGAVCTDRAGVAAIGRTSARQRGKVDKHGIKQFDRYLSNEKVRSQVFLPRIVRRLIAARKEVVVAMSHRAWSCHPPGFPQSCPRVSAI